jgi:hypothetical protein
VLRLVYTPDGGGRQEFEFDPDNPLNLEAEALESVGGEAWQDYPDFLERAGFGNARARRALLWVMLRRTNPQLRFVDVVFNFGEFTTEQIEDDEPEIPGKDEPAESGTDSPSPTPDSAPSPNNAAGP